MKKVFGLLSLLLCLVAVAQSTEILQNPDMNGCENGERSPVTSWTGNAPSFTVQSRSGFLTITDPTDTCLAGFGPDPTQDTLAQDITISTAGNYDFSMSFACIGFGANPQCTLTLSIDGQDIPLTGVTNVAGENPAPFLTATASAIPLTVGTFPFVFKFVYSNVDAAIALTSASLSLPGSGSGDPHMVGFQGQRFDYIGEPGQVVNLVTDPELQVNTLLNLQKIGENSFLPGPVMMEMAFMTRGHTVLINAGGYQKEETGFVTVDGVLLPLGHSFLDGILSVVCTVLNTNSKDLGLTGNDHIVAQVDVKLEGLYEFRVFMIENGKDNLHHSKWVTNYPRRFLDFNASLLDLDRRPHGVLGQTAAPLSKERSVGEWTIEGNDQDYVVKDGLTGTQFTFNQFN